MLTAHGFPVAALALADGAVSLRELAADPPERLALVFGAEGDGLSRHALEAADDVVTIPMAHGVDSLNVAAAAAVVSTPSRSPPYPDEPASTPRAMSRRDPPSRGRARVYRRRRIVVFSAIGMLLAGLVGGGAYSANALDAPIPAAQPAITDPPLRRRRRPGAQPAGLRHLRRGRGRLRRPARRRRRAAPMPIASITKVITALVLLDANPIPAGEGGPEIRYTDADVDIYRDMVAQNGSVAPVAAGSTLSLRRASRRCCCRRATTTRSRSRSGRFGSVDGYLERANAWAAEQGLTNTCGSSTRAGSRSTNTATAADLVRLGEARARGPDARRDRRRPSGWTSPSSAR